MTNSCYTSNKNTLFLPSCLFPLVQPTHGITALALLKSTETTGLRRTPHALVCTICAILSCGAVGQNLKSSGEFQRNGFHDPYHLFTPSLMTKVTLEKLGVWLNPRLVSSNSEGHAATLPLLQCFCITSGTHFYGWPRQQLARFCFRQVLSGAGAQTGALPECKGKLPSATGCTSKASLTWL